MKSFAMSVTTAALLAVSFLYLSGCANHQSPDVGLALMHLQAPPVPAQRTAYVSRHKLPVNKAFRAWHPTHANVSGEGKGSSYHHFDVLFGALNKIPPLMLQNQQAGIEEEVAEGRFVNSEPGWQVDSGFAYLWGWWPVGHTSFVRVGAEGRSGLLLVIEGQTHRIVLISGSKIKIESTDDPPAKLGEIEKPNWMIEVSVVEGVIKAEPPKELPAGDPLLDVIQRLEPLQKFISPD